MKKNIDRQKLKQTKERRGSIRISMILILSFIVCGLCLLNTFKLPYVGDDEINSLTKGALKYYEKSVFDHTWQIVRIWIFDYGRFLPVSFYSYAAFTLFSDLLSYRVFLFSINLIAVAAFGSFVYQLTKRWEIACFTIIMTGVFFQYRDYFDAIISFHGLLQFVVIFFFLSLIFQLEFIEKNKYDTVY